MIAALWTYDGWYGLTFSAGELRNPARNLPRGLIAGTLRRRWPCTCCLNVVYLRALPLAPARRHAARRRGGGRRAVRAPAARWMAGAVVVLDLRLPGGEPSSTARASTMPMAEDGVFFRSLARRPPPLPRAGGEPVGAERMGHRAHRVGHLRAALHLCRLRAVVFHVAYRRRRSSCCGGGAPELPRPYRVWGYPAVPVLFIAACLLLMGNTLWEKPAESLLGTGLLALGVPAYLMFRARSRAAARNGVG